MSAQPFRPEPGAQPVPGYRLLERLGQGGFGEVWKAEGPGGFHLALKFIPLTAQQGPKEVEALLHLREIRHPNLLTVAGAWSIPGFVAIALELAEGTLWDRFEQAQAQGLPGSSFPQSEHARPLPTIEMGSTISLAAVAEVGAVTDSARSQPQHCRWFIC